MAEQPVHLHCVQPSGAQGVFTTPDPGSTLPGSTVTFGWTAGSGATAYWLDIGNTPGGNQYFQSGNLGNVTHGDSQRTADQWQHRIRDAVLAGRWTVAIQCLHLHGVQPGSGWLSCIRRLRVQP